MAARLTVDIAYSSEAYAGLFRRFLSVLIDLLIATPLYFLLFASIPNPQLADAVFIALMVVAYTLLFSSRWQATPGMRAMHVMIETVDHRRLSVLRAFGWCMVSALFMAVAFGAMIYLQTRFDLAAIQQKIIEAQQTGNEASMQRLEALMGMPYPQFQRLLLMSLAVTGILTLGWIASIIFGRQKAGWHNQLCGVRFVKGRAA